MEVIFSIFYFLIFIFRGKIEIDWKNSESDSEFFQCILLQSGNGPAVVTTGKPHPENILLIYSEVCFALLHYKSFFLFQIKKYPTPKIIANEKVKLVIKNPWSCEVKSPPPRRSLKTRNDKIHPMNTDVTIMMTRRRFDIPQRYKF